ncbi:single-stranded DNA-binding protein [Micrococcales bacterium 31B]|nr:single-stranded DNA-binding protein [Micrococcales bacterium 31B]
MARIQATIRGIVGTNPTLHLRQAQGAELPVTQFRLALVDRYRDSQTREWKDGETQWVTVSAFRDLAHNVAASVRKGERVIVEGSLRTQEYLGNDHAMHTDVRLEARSVGHDLRYGTSHFTRTIRTDGTDGAESAETADADDQTGAEQPTYPSARPENAQPQPDPLAAASDAPLVGAPF